MTLNPGQHRSSSSLAHSHGPDSGRSFEFQENGQELVVVLNPGDPKGQTFEEFRKQFFEEAVIPVCSELRNRVAQVLDQLIEKDPTLGPIAMRKEAFRTACEELISNTLFYDRLGFNKGSEKAISAGWNVTDQDAANQIFQRNAQHLSPIELRITWSESGLELEIPLEKPYPGFQKKWEQVRDPEFVPDFEDPSGYGYMVIAACFQEAEYREGENRQSLYIKSDFRKLKE